jgi:NADH-quinone oxidoreductase subunit N
MNALAVGPQDLASVWPELALSGAGVLLLLLDAFLPALRRLLTPLALAGCAVSAWAAWTRVPAGSSFGGLLLWDGVTQFAALVALLSTALCVLASDGYLRRERILGGEYHALLLWCAAGVLLMLRADELLTIFIALELLSVCLYALAGYHRRVAIASEAAIKYFLMGAFVSAFILFGIALLYGQTGSTRLPEIAAALGGASPLLAVLGILMLVAGFGFKMSLVPFHAWSPDAYQGAPSPFVAFLSVAPKAASAIVLVRVLSAAAQSGVVAKGPQLVALLAVVSMLVGNLLALVQRDIKRMLAYSGIAHMGYLLIALASLERDSWGPVLLYLLAYALMNGGAFAIVAMLYAKPGEQHLISDLSGWGYRYPVLGVCLTIAMLSLGGIPPTVGFLAKYLLFAHAIRHGQMWLAVVGVVASLVGVFYYLRVVYVLYMKDEVRAPEGLMIDGWGRLAAVGTAAGTLVLGLLPGRLLDWLRALVEGLS